MVCAIPASMGPNTAGPLSGTPEEIAWAIRAFGALKFRSAIA